MSQTYFKTDVRYNMYFKGGPEDSFISGLWIGNELQDSIVFIECSFNGVKAIFKDCVFIDCDGAPSGEGCEYFYLPSDIRLSPQWRDSDWKWPE
jgi:hypothetical protein